MTSTSSTVRPGRGRRCRGDAFLCRFSVIQSACLHRRFVVTTTDRDASAGFGPSVRMSTSSVRRHHHRSGRLRRLLPSSLHLARTRSVQPIMHDPPGFRDVHRRVLRASSPSNRAAGLLPCRLVGLQHRRPCVSFAVASTSPSPVHRRLYCALFAAPSVCTRSSSC